MARRKKKKKKTTRKSKKASGGDMLVVSSKVKAFIKKKGCNTASDATSGLNNYINWLLSQATTRCKANGRKTVRAHDFIA